MTVTGRLPLFGGALLGLLALLVVLGNADTTYAGTFNPRIRFCFDDFNTVDANPTVDGDPGECDGDNSAGAPATFGVGVDIASGDVNFGGIVSFIPPEWKVTNGKDFPVGTKVGLLEAVATIGIINGACDSTLELVGTAGFTLYNGNIDINDTIEFEDEDKGDPLKADWVEDLDENGLFDAVDKYPAFINRVIQDENDNPQQPIRRSVGYLVIAGADVLVQFLVYEPGTFINKNLSNDAALGYPSVVTLQNIGDPELVPEPGPITDFCTPLGSFTTNFGVGDACDSVVDDDDDGKVNDGCPTLGTSEAEAEAREGGDPCENNIDDDRNDDLDTTRAEGREDARINDGCPADGDSEGDIKYDLYNNPEQEGTYTVTTIAVGQGDADGDGLENSLDTCPVDANIGDPRIKGDGDLDEDGLDAACDPNDDPATGGTNSDQDLDGYVNRQDNCPTLINGEQDKDAEGNSINQLDSDVDEDGDDQKDQIGDPCDDEKLVFNGEPLEERLRTLEAQAEIGPPGPAGDTPTPPSDDGGDDDGGGGALVFIIIGVVAAVVVVGGGAFLLMRRGGGGGGAAA
jgi:hypothetical protein